MYKRNFNGAKNSRSFGGGSYRGARALGGNTQRFGRFSRSGSVQRTGRHGRRFVGDRIDSARFINKAQAVEEEVFVPTHTFADFQIDNVLKDAVLSKGFKTPTPIQDKAIPAILDGRDVVGIANTGTGKTGAFLIPLIHKVITDSTQRVLIIAPTRELAIQIEQELKSLTRKMKIFSVCCVGGAPIFPQIKALRYLNQFVIGTPGRLKDLVERGLIRLPEFQSIVLDEADRMLDMGFIHDMRYVMERMPKVRHTLFFSATLSPTIEKLIHEFLNNPVRISVKTRDTSKNIDQDIVRVERGADKLTLLHDLLMQEEFRKVIIFGETKHGVEKLAAHLTAKGIKAQSIHGNKNHTQRVRALMQFKDNRAQVLVATDVAARGLDIKDVTHVINYDIPKTYDDYIHRIGRTGRGDKKGKALTFVE